MSYDYSSESRRLELPNPYRLQNRFLFVSAAALLLGGMAALTWARTALQASAVHLGMAPLLAGLGLLASGLAFGMLGARRLRFFFGRGRPASLAPEVAVGATGTSPVADHFKGMLRQGGLEYPEPHGALNGVLYHSVPRLITAPLVVQELAQKQFFNALSFVVTLASFALAWGVFGTEQSQPLVGLVYFLFGGFMLLKPLYTGGRAKLDTTSLVVLVAMAIVGPVLLSLLAKHLPSMDVALHGQTFFLLVAAAVAVGLVLLALLNQIDGPPQTERSCEQLTLSMNGPPGALVTELDRRLQNEWTEKIPNRRYTRLEPDTASGAGSGRFAGELFEETQPMPMAGTSTPSLASAMQSPRHRWLVALDLYSTLMVLASIGLALSYVREFDPAKLLEGGAVSHGLAGYSLICLSLAAFGFQSAGQIWGRFNFESVLVWVELLGTWQASRIGTGNQMSSQLQTQNEVVRVESMTLRVWRARVESVVFGKDSNRQVTSMFATAQEAEALAAELAAFAGQQSVFIAPQTSADAQRLGALKTGEALLSAGRPAASKALAATTVHETLRVAATHDQGGTGGRFCSACGHGLAPAAKFCSDCGAAVA